MTSIKSLKAWNLLTTRPGSWVWCSRRALRTETHRGQEEELLNVRVPADSTRSLLGGVLGHTVRRNVNRDL